MSMHGQPGGDSHVLAFLRGIGDAASIERFYH